MMVTRAARRALAKENTRWPRTLRRVPEDDWPAETAPGLLEVWRSRTYLVQVFRGTGGTERLSVCTTALQPTSDRWLDGITWDDLQRLKAECGRGGRAAVEIYPPDEDVVNVANMRHLWVLPEPPPFMWRKRRT